MRGRTYSGSPHRCEGAWGGYGSPASSLQFRRRDRRTFTGCRLSFSNNIEIMKQHYHNICIVGAGRVGTALAVALHKRGHRICAVISHTRRSAQKLSRLVGSPLTSYSIRSMPVDCDVAIIAVPDGQIKIVAREIARLKRKSFASLLVVHTSGIHTAEILSPLAKKGAHTASIHPIQTFPAKAYRADLTNGIFYGIDASGKSVSEAKKLVAALGGNAIVVH